MEYKSTTDGDVSQRTEAVELHPLPIYVTSDVPQHYPQEIILEWTT